MLFNSHLFIFAFLPVVLAGFFALGARSRNAALAWLTLSSLVFYAWWRPVNVLIIAPSVLVNYAAARVLLRWTAEPARAVQARWVLAAGIAFNVAFLGYFKYANFATAVWSDVTGADFVLQQIVLPLGISFITFQKIAFLIDVHGRRIESFTLRDFGLFVLFFPQLIAGPIVHYREMMPQFHRLSGRASAQDLGVGLTLFALGLFKKAVLADGVAAHVAPVYEAAAAGQAVTLLPAWIAALGFTVQIYFDFSGYSDMALGLARCFGVRLPANFDSPLQATNIIDFWLRWHITLTRFLTAYLYNPLVLWLTRRRMARGLPGLRGGQSSWSAYFQLLAGPTVLTMLVSGLWHGAGYLFLAWGALHGGYLAMNHAWRLFGARLWPAAARRMEQARWIGWALTLLAVAVAMVLFRSPTAGAAAEVLQGMLGLHGVGVPQRLVDLAGPLRGSFLVATGPGSGRELVVALSWVASLLFIALALPNTLQLTARFEPAVGWKPAAAGANRLQARVSWSPSLPWAALVCTLAVAALLHVGGKSEFLYWQF